MAVLGWASFLFVLGGVLANPDQRPPVSLQPENVFSHGLLHYRVLRLDEEKNSLYVGAMNHLFRLWMFNVNDTENQAFYAEKELEPASSALTRCAYRSHDPEFHCQNHVRLIFPLKDGSLYICSTNAYSPAVSKLDSSSLGVVEQDISGAAICPVDPNDNGTAVWVERGNPGQIPSVYAGTVTDITQTNRIIYRPPLMDSNGQVLFPFMRTMHTDSKWLNEPNFVGSFEQGDYVYFFFRETAVEFMNCGKAVYSRVARICKNDVGGVHLLKQNWATFLKARLNCSLSGDFPFYFDHIQDVNRVLEAGETLFYATFTTSLNGFFGSAICVFSLGDIDRVFDNGIFKQQTSSTSAWLPVLSSQVPSPRPGQCVPDTKSISDSSLHFIQSHPLMDESVPSQGGGPLFYRSRVVLTTLVVDHVSLGQFSYPVIFAGSVSGEIFKILHWPYEIPTEEQAFLLAVYSLPNKDPIRAMQLLKNEFVYVAQDKVVSQFSPSQCSKYHSCVTCTTDPYCSWNNARQQCYKAHDSHQFASGWVTASPETGGASEQCEDKAQRQTRLLYPADSVHFDCVPQDPETRWLYNNRSLPHSSGRHFLTTDGGLVVVNISTEDSGQYDCYKGRKLLVTYQVIVDKVNCQKPHNVQAFQTVYREWCREFQEYRNTMVKWKEWYEENTQCGRLDQLKRLPNFGSELKSNQITDKYL